MADKIDEELKTRYRFSKNSIEFIADLISEDIERDTKRNKALSPQVLIFLQFVARGSFQQVVGDTIGMDKSTVSSSPSGSGSVMQKKRTVYRVANDGSCETEESRRVFLRAADFRKSFWFS